jgi:hypothetical protein
MLSTLVLAVALSMFVVVGAPVQAGVDPFDVCKEKKAKATGKNAADLLKAYGKNEKKPNATKLSADISKAQSKFTKGFAKAEARSCLTSGDADTIGPKVQAFLLDVLASLARGEHHGSIVANNGPGIPDWALAFLINLFIPDYHSRILAFTECYAGDKVDDFLGDPRTTILAGDKPERTTLYGGYHRDLAQALVPGTTTDAAHAQALLSNKAGDQPEKFGPNQDVGNGGDDGAIESTHVLVWAGQPGGGGLDQQDINDIHTNFDGQTTVTVLAGDGTGQHADGAATFGNLVTALANIGAQMNANEQFVLFVTDHGDKEVCTPEVPVTPSVPTDVALDFPSLLLDDMFTDPSNVPYVSFYTVGSTPIPAGELEVQLNGGPATDVSALTQTALDFDGDAVADRIQYQLFATDGDINPGPNTITMQNNSTSQLDLEMLCIDTGAISRLSSPSRAFLDVTSGVFD